MSDVPIKRWGGFSPPSLYTTTVQYRFARETPFEWHLPGLYPHVTKDYFGPDSTRSIYMVNRPQIWESNRGFATITGNHLGRSGEVLRNRLSPTRVGYRKSDRLLFLNMSKNSSRPKVALVVRGSSEGILVSPAL